MQNLKNKIVIAGIIAQNKKILIAQRAKKDSLYGKWEFPGGKMEAGETDVECLRRELNEEFGIHVTVGSYIVSSFFTHNETQYEMRAYLVTSFDGIISLFDHQQVLWVHPHELSTFDMPDPDKPIVEVIQNNKKIIEFSL